MAITIKKIGKSQYAYLSFREGDRVYQKYLGRIQNPGVAAFVSSIEETNSLPEWLSPLFWDTSANRVELKRHARYIIERVLEFGDPKSLDWLQKTYPSRKILEILFISRSLSDKSREFWKVWFGIDDA